MAAHSDRGFSAQSRILVCGGSVGMSQGQPNTTNPAAELGTAVHELAERALKLGLSCADFIGCTIYNHVITEEMAEGGDVYVNYVRQLKLQYPNMIFHIEKKVCLSSISNNLWGTSDLIGIDLSARLMICLDYKNGYGLVEVNTPQTITGYGVLNGNAQAVGYSLAAMDSLELWGKIDNVITGIVQPNNDEHVDGVIRTKTYNMDEMGLWHQAYSAANERTDIVAGTHCKYCKAAGYCGARIRKTMDLMSLNTSLDKLTEDQMIELLEHIPSMKRTLDAIADQAVVAARKGKELRGHKLVKGIVRGFCTDEVEFINQAVKANPELDTTQLYNKPKLKGMTAVKKLVHKDLVNEFYDKPNAPIKLVPITDKGAAIMPDMRESVVGVFEPVQENK